MGGISEGRRGLFLRLVESLKVRPIRTGPAGLEVVQRWPAGGSSNPQASGLVHPQGGTQEKRSLVMVLVGNSWRIVIGGWSLTKVCHVCLLRSQSDGYPAGSLTPDLPDGPEMIDRWTQRWVLTEFWTNKLLSCPVRSCRKC